MEAIPTTIQYTNLLSGDGECLGRSSCRSSTMSAQSRASFRIEAILLKLPFSRHWTSLPEILRDIEGIPQDWAGELADSRSHYHAQ
jgi:hypothetical protein